MVTLDKIMERLDRLEKKRFVPGSNIRITETENEIRFDSVAQEINPNMKKLLLAMADHIRNDSTPIAGDGILIEKNAGTTTFSIDKNNSAWNCFKPEIKQKESIFPFKTEITDYDGDGFPIVTVKQTSIPNMVILGTMTYSIPEQSFTFKESGLIYMILECSEKGTLSATLKKNDLPESQGLSKYVVPIAAVNSSTVSTGTFWEIEQQQFGHIFVAGRVA